MTRSSTHRWLTRAVIVILALASITVRARQESHGLVRPQNPRELFERARLLEETNQNLGEAIALYSQVVAQAKSDRALAATAQLRMGMSYEKLGKPEASKVYDALLRDFADQSSVAAQARTRLSALAPPKPQTDGTSARRVLTSDSFVAQSISMDGQAAVGTDSRDLVVRSISTGQTTRLVAGSQAAAASAPVLSNDAQQVAYTWAEFPTPPGVQSLQVISAKGGSGPRTLVTGGTGNRVASVGWSSDAKAILMLNRTGGPALATTQSSLAWVSVVDGSVRPIKSFEAGRGVDGFRLSPDGLFIAYSAAVRAGSSEQHIYTVDSSGQSEADVVKIAGSNRQPIWTPDGAHLVFVSDRLGGSLSLWSVAVQNGKAAGDPSPLATNIASVGALVSSIGTLIGMSSSGDLYYGSSQVPGQATFVAERSPAGARITQTFPGLSDSWSPDGKLVAFFRLVSRSYELVIRATETGEEHSYLHDGIGVASPRWFHDSGQLLLMAQNAFYRVNSTTGEFTRLFAKDTDEHKRSGVCALSHDDKTLYMSFRKDDQSPFAGIVGVDLATGAERPVATFGAGSDAPGIAMSPDGTTLAVMARVDGSTGQQARLFTVGVDGSAYREVYGPFPAARTADLMRWTSDGQAILFVTSTNGTNGQHWRVMRIAAAGGQPTFDGLDNTELVSTVTIPRVNALFSIDLNPDDSRIVFGAGTTPSVEVWALENVMAVLNKH